ncbi:hypothetical protein [Streptosporangium sandarakinum]|uniref:hypothetical protein n=1 Tax=Streptosporangium sandarakinum TaxID=1260955 RepID=UPI003715661B
MRGLTKGATASAVRVAAQVTNGRKPRPAGYAGLLLGLGDEYDVALRFRGRAAIVRLGGAVLVEQIDEWTEARRSMGIDQFPL